MPDSPLTNQSFTSVSVSPSIERTSAGLQAGSFFACLVRSRMPSQPATKRAAALAAFASNGVDSILSTWAATWAGVASAPWSAAASSASSGSDAHRKNDRREASSWPSSGASGPVSASAASFTPNEVR